MTHLVTSYSLFSEYDVELFISGHHTQLYNKFGSHVLIVDSVPGVYFAVYAPAAKKVEIIGDFNDWNGHSHQLSVRWDESGIWEGFIPGMGHGDLYKYRIYSHSDNKIREKADPFYMTMIKMAMDMSKENIIMLHSHFLASQIKYKSHNLLKAVLMENSKNFN